MRAGPLSSPSVAELIEEKFVCAWEKKGAVECYRVKGPTDELHKLGGNVIAYVCTPSGEVVHAIRGAVPRAHFYEQLEWAREVHRKITDPATGDPITVARAAHRHAPPEMYDRTMHAVLSEQALRPLAEIEKYFFEQVLGQTYQPGKEIVIREVDLDDVENLAGYSP